MLCLRTQILETQAALARAQAEEEGRTAGNNPTEARRWTGLRTVVEARALLKTLFRAAAGHKGQVWAHAFRLLSSTTRAI